MNILLSITWLTDTIIPAAVMCLTIPVLAAHVVPEFAAVPLASSV